MVILENIIVIFELFNVYRYMVEVCLVILLVTDYLLKEKFKMINYTLAGRRTYRHREIGVLLTLAGILVIMHHEFILV